jgi:uncharacterized RDD family membrane protein YckC
MTQPPDDRHPMPWEPGAGDEATLDDQRHDPSTPAEAPAADDAPPSPDQPAVQLSPIVTAAPSTPAAAASGWVQPNTMTATPLVGWELPGPPPAAPANEGFVVAGVGARIVAYLIDSLLVSIVPTLITLLVTDYAGIFEAGFSARAGGASTRMTVPVTTEIVLASLISVAISYLYFVGFWTSQGRATLGMRGLKMQVVDARSGQMLSLTAATMRWAALGAPLGLLSLIEPLQPVAGLVSACLLVILFLTTIANDRKQGLHDRWSGSLVIRSWASGDGATAVGIVVLVLLWIGFAIIVAVAAFTFLGPQIRQIMSEMGSSI